MRTSRFATTFSQTSYLFNVQLRDADVRLRLRLRNWWYISDPERCTTVAMGLCRC
jgi:hypothetical protein